MFDPGRAGGCALAHSQRLEPVNREAVPAAATEPPIAAKCRSSISFPATASQIIRARQYLEGFLADSPLAADAVLCLSEIATNSVIHSNSRWAGGRFTVNVERYHDGHVRVEVKDQGGPWIGRTKPEGQQSLGLRIVGQLARDWGIEGAGYRARTVWFEVGPIRSTSRSITVFCRQSSWIVPESQSQEAPEMENYCTSCGKWCRLPTFWRCQNCLDRFYNREESRRGTARSGGC